MKRTTKTKTQSFMSPDHPKWDEFTARLEGPEGCDFKEKRKGDPTSVTWTCDSNDRTRPKATAILKDMGFTARGITDSLAYFEEHGGYCDCEILFNVGAETE